MKARGASYRTGRVGGCSTSSANIWQVLVEQFVEGRTRANRVVLLGRFRFYHLLFSFMLDSQSFNLPLHLLCALLVISLQVVAKFVLDFSLPLPHTLQLNV